MGACAPGTRFARSAMTEWDGAGGRGAAPWAMMGPVTEHPDPTLPAPGSPADAPTAAALDAGAAPEAAAGRRPRIAHPWRWLLAGMALGILAFIAAATIPVPKVIESPGRTWNVLGTVQSEGRSTDLISISGAETHGAQGALRMTTVAVSGCPGYPVTALDVIRAWLDPDEIVLDRDQVCPESVTAEQQHEVEQAQMTSSQDAAVTAALLETGLADSMVLTVRGTSDERGDGVFAAGDVIRSVTPVGGTTTSPATYAQLQELMTTIAPGTEVQVVVSREGQDVTLTMATLDPGRDSGREGSLLGVMLDVRANSDVSATFSLSDVGGPSAGSMFALGIIDKITPGDLTGGKDIAGTGTISSDGTIGPIGGIAQKMAGASDAGSRYFLAPAGNCGDVLGHEPEGMEVYAVSNLHEAVQAAEGIAADDTSALTSCRTAATR
ncbi:Lon protease S16 C-terminal proteolytic domain protein [Actinomyces sp. Chiba101]|nr:Lon protease S16 C-terminal proteolytic domain protein [Actinomyces sp. Chiba101]GAV94321.1 Lon protease S16 C-terminal proteolytic domain protein [Actinomyces denticolens]SUU07469.1 ATP-dependent protease Lon [Actinomyces denticolens]